MINDSKNFINMNQLIKENQLAQLFRKFLDNNCTRSELDLLFLHFGTTSDEEELKKMIADNLNIEEKYEEDPNNRLGAILVALYKSGVGSSESNARRHPNSKIMLITSALELQKK